MITRDEAYELLKRYNKEEFHLHHGRMVEGTMRYFAKKLGYGDEEEFWGIVGLLHDIDFEMWPEEHCKKAPELLREAEVGEDMIHAIVSHGYGLCVDVVVFFFIGHKPSVFLESAEVFHSLVINLGVMFISAGFKIYFRLDDVVERFGIPFSLFAGFFAVEYVVRP